MVYKDEGQAKCIIMLQRFLFRFIYASKSSLLLLHQKESCIILKWVLVLLYLVTKEKAFTSPSFITDKFPRCQRCSLMVYSSIKTCTCARRFITYRLDQHSYMSL